MNEYNLIGAGIFNEIDLLEFRDSELAKGRSVDKICVSPKQAAHLANSVGKKEPKKTGKKLIDYWNTSAGSFTITSIHGIEVVVEE